MSRIPDGFRFDVRGDRAADLAKRLSLYRLRAQATIAADPTVAVAAAWDGAAPAAAEAVADSRHADLGARLYAAEGAFSADAAEADYHAHRIALGIPEGGRDYAFGDAFPHEALMDQLGGVDFRKGCYVGQEVVSRMQHRGTARTRILAATYPDGRPRAGHRDQRPAARFSARPAAPRADAASPWCASTASATRWRPGRRRSRAAIRCGWSGRPTRRFAMPEAADAAQVAGRSAVPAVAFRSCSR